MDPYRQAYQSYQQWPPGSSSRTSYADSYPTVVTGQVSQSYAPIQQPAPPQPTVNRQVTVIYYDPANSPFPLPPPAPVAVPAPPPPQQISLPPPPQPQPSPGTGLVEGKLYRVVKVVNGGDPAPAPVQMQTPVYIPAPAPVPVPVMPSYYPDFQVGYSYDYGGGQGFY